jgi:pimeloyl-ACP methyl ester carboxylesterase
VPPLARRVLALGLRSEAMDPRIVTSALVDAYLSPLLRPGTRRALWAYGRDAAGEAPLDLGRIRADTRILAGTADRIVRIATARRLVRAIPGARIDEVAGGRHLLSWDRPDAIAAAILDA